MVTYIISVLLFSLLYSPVIYKLLGRHRYVITAILLLLCLLAEGILWCLGMSWGILLFPAIFMLLTLVMNIDEWNELRRKRQLATLPARRFKTATDSFSLSRRDMLANFRELAGKDSLANCDPEHNFLAWNDAQKLDIRIHLLPGEDWVALLYLTNEELRDSELKAACRKADVPFSKEMMGMAPSGIAICRDGQLSITPASQKKRFDAFRSNVLAPRAEFAIWLADYTEDDAS